MHACHETNYEWLAIPITACAWMDSYNRDIWAPSSAHTWFCKMANHTIPWHWSCTILLHRHILLDVDTYVTTFSIILLQATCLFNLYCTARALQYVTEVSTSASSEAVNTDNQSCYCEKCSSRWRLTSTTNQNTRFKIDLSIISIGL